VAWFAREAVIQFLKSTDFTRWLQTDDAVDVLSVVVSVSDSPPGGCVLDIAGATNECVRLVLWCASLTFRSESKVGDIALALP
jgi:hypothetical protein